MTEQFEAAVKALTSFASQENGKKVVESNALALFSASDQSGTSNRPLNFEVNFLQAPIPNRVPLYWDMPHRIWGESSVCLIVPEPQEKYQEILLKTDAAHCVKKVIDVAKLKGQFAEPVALRALAKSFDVFLVHPSITEYPTLLTGQFLKWHSPIWMPNAKDGKMHKKLNNPRVTDDELTELGSSLAGLVEKSLFRTVIPRRGFNDVSFRIGHTGMAAGEVAANAAFCLEQLAQLDCQLLGVRLSTSKTSGQRLALPIHAAKICFSVEDEAPKSKAAKPVKRQRQ